MPYAHTLCHNRNRVYSPQVGRFLQADPNATAMVLMQNSSYHGRGLGAIAAAFDMQEMYGDGMNLYQYLGSNSWGRSDVMGLSWDAFSLVDDYIAEDAGSKAAFLEDVIGGAKTTAYVSAVLLSQLPFPLGAIAADLGADALEGGMPPQLIAARKILGYVAVAALTATIAKVAITAIKTAIRYVMTYGRRILKAALQPGYLMKQAWKWFSRKREVPGACGCFVAGTVVWTVAGQVPIEQVREGDYVLSRSEDSGWVSFEKVEQEIKIEDAAILEVTLIFEDGRTSTLNTTDEHPFRVKGRGWSRADQLQPGDRVETVDGAATVISLSFLARRAPVYNLSVAGTHTFHVGSDGVLVHNCKLYVTESLPRHMLMRRPARRGLAPKGVDGKAVELHHPDSSKPMEVRETLMTPHRGPGQVRTNHPEPWPGMSDADRAAYNAEREKYWNMQWDLGRFEGLPE